MDDRIYRLSVAPMTGCTDRRFRQVLRLIAPRVLLHTGMVAAGKLVRGQSYRQFEFDPVEHPLALQLGGADARELALAAVVGVALGYDQINVNAEPAAPGGDVACIPDPLVDPQWLGDCVALLRARVRVPVTVKMRIGSGSRADASSFTDDDYQRLRHCAAVLAMAGCSALVVHARKAVAGARSCEMPQIPPLRHDVLLRLKRDLADVPIIANGGIATITGARRLLAHLDGVMIGRKAREDPWFMARLQHALLRDVSTYAVPAPGQMPVSRFS